MQFACPSLAACVSCVQGVAVFSLYPGWLTLQPLRLEWLQGFNMHFQHFRKNGKKITSVQILKRFGIIERLRKELTFDEKKKKCNWKRELRNEMWFSFFFCLLLSSLELSTQVRKFVWKMGEFVQKYKQKNRLEQKMRLFL